MSLLEVCDVSRHFGGVLALSHLSFAIDEASIFGLIGPNGAGKTTLFNLITGIFPASEGKILFEGNDITGWSTARIARSGLTRTFQSIHLYSGLSVLQNVMMGQTREAETGLRSLIPFVADRRERDLARGATKVLEFLDLQSYALDSARDLPYALQRKVELARALASQPRLVLLDEPAAGCDEQESQALALDIRRIRDRGTTVLLIEHDMSVVMDVCDRIAVLNFGEKLAEDIPGEIQKNPRVIEAYLGQPNDEFVAAH